MLAAVTDFKQMLVLNEHAGTYVESDIRLHNPSTSLKPGVLRDNTRA